MRNLLAFALAVVISIPISSSKTAFVPKANSTANIYYISTTGVDSNPGTFAQPWRTILKAANMVQAGDTIYIRGGTYHESNIFYTDGTQTAPITISGYFGEEAIIDGNAYQIPNKNSGNALIQVYGDWYIIRDLTITQSGDQGITLHGGYDTIENVYSHHNWGWGILMTGNFNLTQNSRVWSNSMMNENHVMSAGWSGGVTCARYPDYCTIRNTKSWENWGEGISTFESMHTTIKGNTSYDNQQNIYISDTKFAMVQGNLSYCTAGNEIDPYELQNGILVYEELGVPIPLAPNGTRNKSSDNTFLNNIVIGCDNNLFATQNQAANNLYAYNTFVNSDNNNPGYAANIQFQSGTASNQSFINNLIYQSNGIAIAQIDQPGIISFSNNLWSKTPPSSVSGPGDVIGDPKLAMTGSPYSPDWSSLSDSSPAKNKGIVISVTNLDFYDTIRDAFPDIGALEYTGSAPTFADVPITYSTTLGGITYLLHDYIQALYDAGYTAGCQTPGQPLQYCPTRTFKRDESAVFMLRGIFGGDYGTPANPLPAATGTLFVDMTDVNYWGTAWAEAMFQTGLTAGCWASPLRFCPLDMMSREQASVFGLRLKYGVTYGTDSNPLPAATGTLFADMNDKNYWSTAWAEKAYLDGLLPPCGTQSGKPLFCPTILVDRAWAAYLIVKAKGILP